MGKRGSRPLSAHERALAHMDAAKKYTDQRKPEKAVAHVKRAMHYGGARFGAPVEWQKITTHEGNVALFDVTDTRGADIAASSSISEYEASDRGAAASKNLEIYGGIIAIPYLTEDHRMYAYYSLNDPGRRTIAGLFVKPSVIDSVHAVQMALVRLGATDTQDAQAKLTDLQAKKEAAPVDMKGMFERNIAKIRGDISSSKAALAEARLQDARDWHDIVLKTNELVARAPDSDRGELTRCILSHLARRKLLSKEEIKRGGAYSSVPYTGRVCVDHTGLSISEIGGQVRYVHTFVTRHKPDGSVEPLAVHSRADTAALCAMREATHLAVSPLGVQKGPIVCCIASTAGACTLFAELDAGAVSCIYVAPYFDVFHDKLGQVSTTALLPVGANHVTADVFRAVTTANDLKIPDTSGVCAAACRVRLFLLLMKFQSFGPSRRGGFSVQTTPGGWCDVSISEEDATENKITIHEHDALKRMTSRKVVLAGSDTSMDALKRALNMSSYDRRN
jgi:hypothetical protein